MKIFSIIPHFPYSSFITRFPFLLFIHILFQHYRIYAHFCFLPRSTDIRSILCFSFFLFCFFVFASFSSSSFPLLLVVRLHAVLLLSRDFPTSNVSRLVIGWRLLLPSHWLSPLVVLASDWCFPMLLLPPDWSLLISDACLLARDWWAAREEPVKVVADSPHVFTGLLGNASQRASCRRGRRSSRLLNIKLPPNVRSWHPFPSVFGHQHIGVHFFGRRDYGHSSAH